MTNRFLLKELSRYEIGTFADVINRNAILYPDEEAFVYRDQRLTFGRYNERVNGLVHALNGMGVRKGDVVGILSWNCTDYVEIFGAAMKGGFIVSPYNPRLQADELEYLINYSEAVVVFVGPELVDTVNGLRDKLPGVGNYIAMEKPSETMVFQQDLIKNHSTEEPDSIVTPDDPVFIIYTSGTTGVPRGALYTQRRKLEDSRRFVYDLNLSPGRKAVMPIPLFHVAGISYLLAFFFGRGATVIYPERAFDSALTWKIIQDEAATDIHIVPTNLIAMLNVEDLDSYDVSSMQRIWYAGSPMPVEVLKKGMARLGPIFMQAYGQSESGPLNCTFSPMAHDVMDKSAEEQKVLASCGKPIHGVHVRIVDAEKKDVAEGEIGEIIIKNPAMMTEYWKRPEDTEKTVVDSWLQTGDMGYYDNTGNIYLADRKKDMIISGGENIYPREVEEILYQHPAVEEAAVIGVPDPYWVERVHAVIVLRKGAMVDEKGLAEFCKQRMARYKTPKSFDFPDALPKSPQGKVLKKELRKQYNGEVPE